MIERTKIDILQKSKNDITLIEDIKSIVLENQKTIRCDTELDAVITSEWINSLVKDFRISRPRKKTKVQWEIFAKTLAEKMFYHGYADGFNIAIGPTWKDLMMKQRSECDCEQCKECLRDGIN